MTFAEQLIAEGWLEGWLEARQKVVEKLLQTNKLRMQEISDATSPSAEIILNLLVNLRKNSSF